VRKGEGRGKAGAGEEEKVRDGREGGEGGTRQANLRGRGSE